MDSNVLWRATSLAWFAFVWAICLIPIAKVAYSAGRHGDRRIMRRSVALAVVCVPILWLCTSFLLTNGQPSLDFRLDTNSEGSLFAKVALTAAFIIVWGIVIRNLWVQYRRFKQTSDLKRLCLLAICALTLALWAFISCGLLFGFSRA